MVTRRKAIRKFFDQMMASGPIAKEGPWWPDFLKDKDRDRMLNIPHLLRSLATGMTACRTSWPIQMKQSGLHLRDETIYLGDWPWNPRLDDLVADDWEIGD